MRVWRGSRSRIALATPTSTASASPKSPMAGKNCRSSPSAAVPCSGTPLLLAAAGLGVLIAWLRIVAFGAGMDRKRQGGERLLDADAAADRTALIQELARRRMPQRGRDVMDQLVLQLGQHQPIGADA